jgi:hypothetical protein
LSIVSADRKMIRYQLCRPPDTILRVHLRELANARRRSAIAIEKLNRDRYGPRSERTARLLA